MTPARKRALQWFHDRGEVRGLWDYDGAPSAVMVSKMRQDGQLIGGPGRVWSLTDKGRRALHGDDK